MRTAPPRLVAAIGCGLLLLTPAARGSPADDKIDSKPKSPETKKIHISRLPNEEIVKHATAIYSKGSGEYHAALRALAGAEVELDEATKQLAALVPPKVEAKKKDSEKKDGEKKDGEAEDAAKAAVEAAKAKAAFAQQTLKLTQSRKLLQEQVATALEGVQSASSGFLATLDDLKPFALELKLRVDDGSLRAKLPAELQPDIIAQKRKDLVAEQDKFKDKLADARKAVEAVAKQVAEADKGFVTAEAEATEASRGYAREQSRKELEKKYTGKSADNMLTEIQQLVQDGQGLKGTYELAFQRFTTQSAAADALRKELAALKPPEAKITQITRAEDVEPAIKAIESLIKFHTDRVAKLESLRKSLETVAKQGSEFEGDAAVSDDHLFKMQVLSALIVKAGQAEKLPEQAGTKRLEDAAARAKKLAGEVRANTDKAKADLAPLEKELTEAKTARTAATQQLANLKQSQEATLFALRFEEQLGKMDAAGVLDQFQQLRKTLTEKAAALEGEEVEYKKALAAVTEARAKLDSLKDPLLRAAEERGQSEKQRLLAELRKEAGLDRVATGMPMMPPVAEPKKSDEKKAEEKEKKPEPPPPPPLEQQTTSLSAFQQQLAARARVLDERAVKTAALLAALDDLATKATNYARNVNQTRQAALQLNGAAVEIKKRVGRGELDGSKVPNGTTEALVTESRKKLDEAATAVVNVASQTQQERDALKKPDPQAEALKALTKELLSFSGQRLDLLGDLKKLAADYKIPKKERPESEQKRLDQTASERMDKDSGKWEWLLILDKSKHSTSLSELIESYYREMVEIEDKEENLKKQKAKIDELIELTGKERTALQNGLPVLEKELARVETLKEEEGVLARARIKPEIADELLKAYQTKSGRMLPKPLPLGEQDQAARIEELGNALFERSIEVEAAKKWEDILSARLATAGLTAEAGVYQDELAQLNAASGANTRRVHTLTGNPPPESGQIGTSEQTKLPATGGEIGKSRDELNTIRTRGVQRIGIKIAIIILAAFLLPRIILFILRRALGIGRNENGNSSMVLTAIRAFLKVIVWVIAIAMILSTLGFDVTAIVAGLGIGGLAIGLAAQPMISDVIGAIIIFAEQRFKIGDVVKMGSDEPARIVGLTWRSTALRNTEGLVVSVPNRKVTETTLVNLTKAGQTYDSIAVTVSTDKDVNAILELIKKAMTECKNLSTDHGVSVRKFNQKGSTKVVEYRFWWFLKDYEARNKTRDEVFARIGVELAHENLTGTEVTLA